MDNSQHALHFKMYIAQRLLAVGRVQEACPGYTHSVLHPCCPCLARHVRSPPARSHAARGGATRLSTAMRFPGGSITLRCTMVLHQTHSPSETLRSTHLEGNQGQTLRGSCFFPPFIGTTPRWVFFFVPIWMCLLSGDVCDSALCFVAR